MLLICDHGFIVCLLLFLVGFFCFSLFFLNSYQTYDHRKFKGALHLNEKRHICRWSYVDLAVNYIYFLQILSTSFWFAKRSLSIVINCRNLKVFFQRAVILSEIDAISTVICSHWYSRTIVVWFNLFISISLH